MQKRSDSLKYLEKEYGPDITEIIDTVQLNVLEATFILSKE
jgi:hypothetical protein